MRFRKEQFLSSQFRTTIQSPKLLPIHWYVHVLAWGAHIALLVESLLWVSDDSVKKNYESWQAGVEYCLALFYSLKCETQRWTLNNKYLQLRTNYYIQVRCLSRIHLKRRSLTFGPSIKNWCYFSNAVLFPKTKFVSEFFMGILDVVHLHCSKLFKRWLPKTSYFIVSPRFLTILEFTDSFPIEPTIST